LQCLLQSFTNKKANSGIWLSALLQAAREAGYTAVNNAYELATRRAAAAGATCVKLFAILFGGQDHARAITLPANAVLNDVLQAVTSASSHTRSAAQTETAAAAVSCSAVDTLLDALTLAAGRLKASCFNCSASAGITDGDNVICVCATSSSKDRAVADATAGAAQSKRKRKEIIEEQADLQGQLRVLARCAVRLHVISSSSDSISSSSNSSNNSSSSSSSSSSAAHVIRQIRDTAKSRHVSRDASAKLIYAKPSQPEAAPAAAELAADTAVVTAASATVAAAVATVTTAVTATTAAATAAVTTPKRTASSAKAIAVVANKAANVVVRSDSDSADTDDDVMIVEKAPAAKKAVVKAVATTAKQPIANSTSSNTSSSSSSSSNLAVTPSSGRKRARPNVTPVSVSSCSSSSSNNVNSSINGVNSSYSGRPAVKSRVATVSRFVSKQAALVVSAVDSLVQADYAQLIAEDPDDVQQHTNNSSDSESDNVGVAAQQQQHSSSSVYCNCTEAQQKLIRKTLKVRTLS
jgi:trimeric autotransporter adhesin